MKEYLLRIDGKISDIEPLERCPDQCHEVEELEAVMVAMIKTLREEIQGLKGRITELEGNSTAPNYIQPSDGTPVTPFSGWKITCNRL